MDEELEEVGNWKLFRTSMLNLCSGPQKQEGFKNLASIDRKQKPVYKHKGILVL